MKRSAGIILAGLLVVFSAWPAGAPVRWIRDLKQGTEAARESGRPILIDFWADWCEPCKKMDAEVYGDPAIGAAVQKKFVTVRINFDMQPELARAYRVEALPHLVVTDSLGTELIHHRGILDSVAMASLVEALPAEVMDLNRLDQAVRQDRNDVTNLLGMARKLRESGFYESSGEYYGRALKEAPKNTATREPILREMALNYLELKDGSRAAPVLERYLREIRANEHTPECLLKLAESYILTAQRGKAETAARKLESEYPLTAEARQVRSLLMR